MCGIFGVVLTNNNNENVYELIISGLKQLQNRGYDSSGLSIISNDKIEVYKYSSTVNENALEKLEKLNLIKNDVIKIGIGHNRWATHGIKNDTNAHPHLSNNKNFSIVHNRIIENYNELKQQLIKCGYTFYSQTDTEVIANLIDYNYNNNMIDAIKKSIYDMRGTYGLLIQSLYEPNKLFCVRNGSPLLIGQNENSVIISSEQIGFCNRVNNYITLNNNDIATIEKTEDNILVTTKNTYIKKELEMLNYSLTSFPYKHWTLKEIYEQPSVVMTSINNGGRIKSNSEIKLGGLEKYADIFKKTQNIILLGCGTSYFACLYGMYFFKKICNFNTVQVFDGAQFNYFDIPKYGNTVFILVSQSGETKDLHNCIEIAKNKNIITIGIINVVDSLISRDVDCGIYCNAGREVGVASTKSFTSQVVCLSLASLWFSNLQGIKNIKRIKIIEDLQNLSNDITNTLNNCKEQVKNLSKKIVENNMFILGNGSDEYIAKEGSLKIKEISYIHSEGYSSSSLKHGPFALLDEKFPVIILNLDNHYRDKSLNCYHEVSSRKSPIIFITNDNSIYNELNCEIILIPENKTYGSLLGIIPLQLLAYYLSINKGINPDTPKNLAKVVTVE